MWKVSWFYEKVHDFLVVPLYYHAARSLRGVVGPCNCFIVQLHMSTPPLTLLTVA